MCSLINKQLLLTAYAYLFIMEQQKAQRGSEALQLYPRENNTTEPRSGPPATICQPQQLQVANKNQQKPEAFAKQQNRVTLYGGGLLAKQRAFLPPQSTNGAPKTLYQPTPNPNKQGEQAQVVRCTAGVANPWTSAPQANVNSTAIVSEFYAQNFGFRRDPRMDSPMAAETLEAKVRNLGCEITIAAVVSAFGDMLKKWKIRPNKSVSLYLKNYLTTNNDIHGAVAALLREEMSFPGDYYHQGSYAPEFGAYLSDGHVTDILWAMKNRTAV